MCFSCCKASFLLQRFRITGNTQLGLAWKQDTSDHQARISKSRLFVWMRMVSASHILNCVSESSGHGDGASCVYEDCRVVSTLHRTLSTCALFSGLHAFLSCALTGIWHSDGQSNKGTVQSQVALLSEDGASFAVLRGQIVSALQKENKKYCG